MGSMSRSRAQTLMRLQLASRRLGRVVVAASGGLVWRVLGVRARRVGRGVGASVMVQGVVGMWAL